MTASALAMAFEMVGLQRVCARQAEELAWHRAQHGFAPAAEVLRKLRLLEVEIHYLREALEEIVERDLGPEQAKRVAADVLARTPPAAGPRPCPTNGELDES